MVTAKQNRLRQVSFCFDVTHVLTPEVQYADQREQAACGIDVDVCFALKPFLQHSRAFIVDTATGHIDCFDLAGGQGFDSIKVAFADLKLVFDDLPERAK